MLMALLSHKKKARRLYGSLTMDPKENLRILTNIRPALAQKSGRVFKCLYGGEEVLELAFPKHSSYKENRYSPTSVAVDEIGRGGSWDIWVSDGYGANLVHRYSNDGEYNLTIDGSSGAGHFNCPHGIFNDRRRDLPELYVADRANSRIQVFDLEGRLIWSFGSDF